jgi:hypothetical protein
VIGEQNMNYKLKDMCDVLTPIDLTPLQLKIYTAHQIIYSAVAGFLAGAILLSSFFAARYFNDFTLIKEKKVYEYRSTSSETSNNSNVNSNRGSPQNENTN